MRLADADDAGGPSRRWIAVAASRASFADGTGPCVVVIDPDDLAADGRTHRAA